MAFDFPNTPTVGQTYPQTPQPGQPVYTWDGEKWMANVDALYAPPVAASALPKANAATAVVGTSSKYAREDHVHPTGTMMMREDEIAATAAEITRLVRVDMDAIKSELTELRSRLATVDVTLAKRD